MSASLATLFDEYYNIFDQSQFRVEKDSILAESRATVPAYFLGELSTYDIRRYTTDAEKSVADGITFEREGSYLRIFEITNKPHCFTWFCL